MFIVIDYDPVEAKMMTKNFVPVLVRSAAIACIAFAMPLAAQETSCPDPDNTCNLFHPGSLFTAGCEGPMCFSKSYADAVTVIATDDNGLFPKVWNLWSGGELDSDVAGTPCDLSVNGNLTNDNKVEHKYKVLIPDDGSIRCTVDVHQGEYIYHEHFVANPNSGCLGWIECRTSNGTTAASTELLADFLDKSDVDDAEVE